MAAMTFLDEEAPDTTGRRSLCGLGPGRRPPAAPRIVRGRSSCLKAPARSAARTLDP
ncbi:hypothetical protein GCM10009559_65250 [Pseudonocardia zijingensis]|uniref:Uncharacterized protein n=1 Tax=Pseudonocardia zijingensis TaxID=153376 RepID=A0ABN1NAK5_9PSEU